MLWRILKSKIRITQVSNILIGKHRGTENPCTDFVQSHSGTHLWVSHGKSELLIHLRIIFHRAPREIISIRGA